MSNHGCHPRLFDTFGSVGESLPQPKESGDSLLAGTRLLSPRPVIARATNTYEDSTLFLMKKALAAGLDQKASLERKSTRMASMFTPFTLAMAACALRISDWQQLGDAAGWQRVLSVLMAATPCPAAIGVPIAFLSGMSLSSSRGVSIKSGVALGNLGKVRQLVVGSW